MTEQTKMEIIKALAYGETPAQIAVAEDVDIADVQKIAAEEIAEIQTEQEMLRKVGYIHD